MTFAQADELLPSTSYSLAPGATFTSGLLLDPNRSVRFGAPLLSQTLGTGGDSADLALFTGSGTTGVAISTFTQTLLGNTGGLTSSSQVTNADFDGTVIYTFTPAPPPPPPVSTVPEPFSAVLLATGLIGLAASRRRRG